MIRVVFFDIGNTLFFYNYKFFSDLLRQRFDIDRDPRELEAIHYSLGEMIQQKAREWSDHQSLVKDVYHMWLEEMGVDGEKIPRIIEVVDTHPFPHLFWAKMGEGVRETLDWFKDRGIKMGVISNAEGQIKRLLEHVGVDEYFDVVLDSKEVGIEKPDIRIFRKALDCVGARPEEAIHVGDLLETDVMGSKAAGMTPVLVDRENRHAEVDVLRVRRVYEVIHLPLFEDYR